VRCTGTPRFANVFSDDDVRIHQGLKVPCQGMNEWGVNGSEYRNSLTPFQPQATFTPQSLTPTRAPAPLMDCAKNGPISLAGIGRSWRFRTFSGKEASTFFSRFGLLADRASSARFSHSTARRLGPRRAAPELVDSCGQRGVGPGARFCAHLAFPARDRLVLGSFPALRPNLAKSRSGVESMVTGAMLLVSNLCFSSAGSYQRRE